jgi:hypothetical protein
VVVCASKHRVMTAVLCCGERNGDVGGVCAAIVGAALPCWRAVAYSRVEQSRVKR